MRNDIKTDKFGARYRLVGGVMIYEDDLPKVKREPFDPQPISFVRRQSDNGIEMVTTPTGNGLNENAVILGNDGAGGVLYVSVDKTALSDKVRAMRERLAKNPGAFDHEMIDLAFSCAHDFHTKQAGVLPSEMPALMFLALAAEQFQYGLGYVSVDIKEFGGGRVNVRVHLNSGLDAKLGLTVTVDDRRKQTARDHDERIWRQT